MPAIETLPVDHGESQQRDRERPALIRGDDELVAPLKVMRLLKALGAGFDELTRVDVDDAARRHLIAAHRAVLIEVASTVSDGLMAELVRLGFAPLSQDASVDQIKVAQAQLLGWVNGVVLARAAFGAPTQVDAPGALPRLHGQGARDAAR
jgi:hypothetical protein